MTGPLIFKMELFKFFRDKRYLLAIGILAILNTSVTLFYSIFLTTSRHLAFDSVLVRFSSIIGIVTALLVFANMIFTFLFPFHILSIDYKNNVMAMMIASGVNRTRLFFAKIGAVILLSLGLFLAISIGPFIIVLIQTIIGGQINEFFSGFLEFFKFLNLDINVIQIMFSALLAVFNSVVVITAATILMKGKNTAIIVSMGFGMLSSFLSNFFNQFAFSTEVTIESMAMVQAVSSVISIAVFCFVGLLALQKQNL